MQPIREKVLVKPFPADEATAGGIFVPENCRESSSKVLVVAVGNGIAKEPMRFKKGDVAFRVKDTGEKFVIDGEEYFLMPQSYLIAKLN